MKINGKIEVKGFTRVEDLDAGDVFIFLDESNPYIVGVDKDNGDTYVINLRDGTMTEIIVSGWFDRPVEKLNAELVIK
jgi:hypothetical protein